jgi:hypothetical protein
MKMDNSIKLSNMNWELKQIKRFGILIILFTLVTPVFSQVAPEKYWIPFTDKDNSPFSVNTPLVYLSQKALNRRNAQGITVTSQDFPVNPAYVQGVKQAANVDVLIQSRWLNGIVIQTTDTVGLAQIMALPYVDSSNAERVENDKGAQSAKMETTGMIYKAEDIMINGSEALNYGLSEQQNVMIGVDYLHDLGFTGSGMTIAVLDAGFFGADTTTALLPLFNNSQVVGTWDFVTGQPVDYTQHSTHGKSVLNCMGANIPGFYIGSAPDANYWLIRTEDAPTENIIEEYNWVVGAEFADSVGADVVNTSLGYTTFDDSTKSHTYADLDGNTTVITRGADIAASKGMLMINSAGNSGSGSWHYIGAPADGDSVLAIGAVSANRLVTDFSSRGPSADGRVKPNVMAMGGGVPMPIGNSDVQYINGTSFSGPILAGAATCLWQARSGYNNMEIFHAIEESADKYLNPNSDYGYGIPNMGMAYYLITSVEDVSKDGLSIQGYPNPTTGIIYLPIGDNKPTEILIYDFLGHPIKSISNISIQNGSIEVDLSQYSSGIYVVEVVSSKGVQILRVLKQ